MGAQTKLSAKGQCVIPAEVRAAKGWSAGEVFDIFDTEDGIELVPAAEKDRLFGPPITWEEFRALVPAHEGPPIPEADWAPAIGEMFRNDPQWR